VRNELKDQVSDLVMQGVNAVLDKEVDAKAHQSIAEILLKVVLDNTILTHSLKNKRRLVPL
jgi:F0F1-type ATP synthase membrane subunit b/b'